jgi:UDP-N-acetylmuramoyl-L-alanyl-D-glutamate--2,6-diaminopimelate ligase
LRSLTDHLIVVAGAGGDRDKQMRPVLGQLMAEYADHVFLTTDNPRSENPADIIAQMYAGISSDKKHKIICELDRERAIRKAIDLSRERSIIALLGKGPEQYQIIGTEKIPFSERAIIQNL